MKDGHINACNETIIALKATQNKLTKQKQVIEFFSFMKQVFISYMVLINVFLMFPNLPFNDTLSKIQKIKASSAITEKLLELQQ